MKNKIILQETPNSVWSDLLCKISARISASGSCRTTCARSLYADFLSKISFLMQDLCIRISCAKCPCQDLCIRMSAGPGRRSSLRIQKRNFTRSPRDGHALGNQNTQLYQHFARWTRTISAKGCTSKSENTTLPAFRAIDTKPADQSACPNRTRPLLPLP